jgi:GDP-mannose pyrophosphatase NudK
VTCVKLLAAGRANQYNCTNLHDITRKTMNHFVTPSTSDRIRVIAEQVLSDDWFVLRKTTFDFRRNDGSWQQQSRETYDRGNGAVLLLYNPERSTVVLTRQFRFPAYVNGSADGMLIEACAGLLDGDDPHAAIRREVAEETGFVVRSPKKLFEAYMSPGSVTEKLHFFAAEYDDHDRLAAGGGDASEGEDIEVMELPLATALRMITEGRIQDGKTIMLLQHAALVGWAKLR